VRLRGAAPFAAGIIAEYWLAEVHREIVSDNWRPPLKDSPAGSDSVRLSRPAQEAMAVAGGRRAAGSSG